MNSTGNLENVISEYENGDINSDFGSAKQDASAELPAPTPTMLLVLGMHRSGTSLVTRLLECLGAVNSINIMPGNRDNPKGFF
jgi:hypothetical protein